MSEKNLSTKCTKLLSELARTRNLRTLGLMVKAGIARRDRLKGRDVDHELEVIESKLRRISDSKTAKRARAAVEAVLGLPEPADVATFVSAAIDRRRVIRAKA